MGSREGKGNREMTKREEMHSGTRIFRSASSLFVLRIGGEWDYEYQLPRKRGALGNRGKLKGNDKRGRKKEGVMSRGRERIWPS